MGGVEVLFSDGMEPSVKYHSAEIYILTSPEPRLVLEIPNYKSQITNKLQIPIF